MKQELADMEAQAREHEEYLQRIEFYNEDFRAQQLEEKYGHLKNREDYGVSDKDFLQEVFYESSRSFR